MAGSLFLGRRFNHSHCHRKKETINQSSSREPPRSCSIPVLTRVLANLCSLLSCSIWNTKCDYRLEPCQRSGSKKQGLYIARVKKNLPDATVLFVARKLAASNLRSVAMARQSSLTFLSLGGSFKGDWIFSFTVVSLACSGETQLQRCYI